MVVVGGNWGNRRANVSPCQVVSQGVVQSHAGFHMRFAFATACSSGSRSWKLRRGVLAVRSLAARVSSSSAGGCGHRCHQRARTRPCEQRPGSGKCIVGAREKGRREERRSCPERGEAHRPPPPPQTGEQRPERFAQSIAPLKTDGRVRILAARASGGRRSVIRQERPPEPACCGVACFARVSGILSCGYPGVSWGIRGYSAQTPPYGRTSCRTQWCYPMRFAIDSESNPARSESA